LAISEDPCWWLGHARGDRHLPFLLKLLAAAAPLSIQVHPSSTQAEEGYAREERAGKAIAAADRIYRDRSDKPEILRALTAFTALYGFRPRAQIGAALDDLGLAELLPGTTVRAQVERLVLLEEEERSSFAVRAQQAARQWCASQRARWSKEATWICRLAESYPEDPWILAPLLLHLVELEAGEALFTESGIPHAYLEGLGVELMNSSDNVIRAGLTSKAVDPEELLRVVDSRKAVVVKRRSVPGEDSGMRTFRTPATDFELSELTCDHSRTLRQETRDRLEVLLVAHGQFEVSAAGSGDEDALVLAPTEAAVVPAACSAYEITGSGLLFRARRPI
jgi:mannose-6-phosphate isomerase